MTSRTDSAPEGAQRLLPDGVVAAVGLVVVLLFVFWDARNGGSSETDWLPGAMLLAGLALFLAVGSNGGVRRLGRAELVALASLGGLTIWAFLSIVWADVGADAWSGANRMFLYLIAFSLFTLLPWRIPSATFVLSAYVVGTAAIAVLAVARSTSATDRFIDGRLSFPTGYPNANAALFLSAFWVALMLATRSTVPIAARVAAAGAAAFLPQAAMLSQSRGSVVAVPLTGLVVLALIPGRLRTITGIAAASAVVAASWKTHTAVFDAAFAGRGLEAAISRSEKVMLATSLLVALATLAWAAVDTRIAISRPVTLKLERAVAVIAAIAVVALAAGIVASGPVHRAQRAWSEFTAVDATDASKPHLSLGIGSNRYDFWRVALAQFEARPLTGIGSDNFSVPYVRERRSAEEPAYPHSLVMMLLSQLGLVGTALFSTFLLGAALAAVPRRSEDPATIALGGAALAGSTYFFVHASADWFWEIPALGAPALALLGLAVSLRASQAGQAPAVARVPRRGLAAVAVVAGLGVASCALPWLSERQIDRAVAVWRDDPPAAYDLLASARALNPLSARPDLVAGVIASRLDDRSRMPELFARSLQRNPYNWYAQLELGLAQSVTGQQAAAVASVRRALELNPREPLLREVEARLEQGERIAPRTFDQLFISRIQARTG